MLTAISFFLFFFILPSVSAVQITEVEMNPEGGSSGTEWIEIYNEDSGEINISGWTLYDGLSSPKLIFVVPNETIIDSEEHYLVELSSSKLNNGGDFVTLYDYSGEKIDETPTFDKDDDADVNTWQLCDGEWMFEEETPEEENDCPESEPPAEEPPTQNDTGSDDSASQDNADEDPDEDSDDNNLDTNSNIDDSKDEDDSEKDKVRDNKNAEEPEEVQVIYLNPKKENSGTASALMAKEEKIKIGVIYTFTIFSLVVVLFVVFRKF